MSADSRRSTPELRTEIARLDREVLERLEARARASKEIRTRSESEPSADSTDRDALAALATHASGDLPPDALSAIFGAIRAAGRAIEQAPRVAYLGPEGGFCHVLSRAHFGAGGAFIESATVESALEEVARGRAACAVFPFESSSDGLVQTSITALTDTELVIVGARTLPVTFELMGRAGALADIEKVYTTPAGHAACQRFLDAELPRVSVIDVRSMKVAAELAQEDATSAAILPEPTGREHALELLRQNVGDAADTKMRYAIAAPRPASRSGADATCLLFSIDDKPGSLFDILRHFAERGINLRRLHSRPAGREPWDYVFYVEIGGHATDRGVITALEAVKKSTRYLRVLGSFPQEA
ncbi:MAG: bifunctional chorismate mutase/prephenate dehydratase [Myxococcales bacterium]|nr:MAG: bifunctional chorismate mutase/prephenate dehydratase [Myxococcales bacterium]